MAVGRASNLMINKHIHTLAHTHMQTRMRTQLPVVAYIILLLLETRISITLLKVHTRVSTLSVCILYYFQPRISYISKY